MTLTLVATITALSGQTDAVEAGLRQLVSASRAEAGCLQYDLHRHQDDANVFVMIEQWQDSAALAFHQGTDHYRHFKATCGDALQGVALQPLNRIA
ncbi:putative quinol monooxygenase [Phytopseudomonas seleniipraecipitans]|uniref:Quinol monooxygenase YgiN n=1 Tax=Phytopseudomonas seleniipraecipitans TaxID=640205 RepID=A0A1G7KDE5_9GAMM|nr:putative quinol monooxygenase [Pseudomonas seleniipraecipitans]SDF34839.1 Quinol monooxygenase YgiN [Pseudomonas seleniipraecipitans]